VTATVALSGAAARVADAVAVTVPVTPQRSVERV